MRLGSAIKRDDAQSASETRPYMPYIVLPERSAVTGSGVFGAVPCELLEHRDTRESDVPFSTMSPELR